jgi:hypothetical protein
VRTNPAAQPFYTNSNNQELENKNTPLHTSRKPLLREQLPRASHSTTNYCVKLPSDQLE